MNKDNKLNRISDHKELVLDTGVILNYLGDPDADSTKWLDKHIMTESSQVTLHSHEVNRAELLYLICREEGMRKAKEILKSIEDFIVFHNELELIEIVGKLKCNLSIALADCFSIATGLWLKSPILFRKERELSESIIESLRKEFKANLLIFDS